MSTATTMFPNSSTTFGRNSDWCRATEASRFRCGLEPLSIYRDAFRVEETKALLATWAATLNPVQLLLGPALLGRMRFTPCKQ
jgi:hypothetical protein